MHEDHSDPIVHVDVTYHVGSAREQVGKSGFAHFFEHMMFQGSDHVADDEHFKLVSEAGGASFLDDIITYNLDSDFVDQQTKIPKGISKAELDTLGSKHLPLDKMVIVVVGDKAQIKPGLEKLGYEIVETDTGGKPLTAL